MSVVCHHVVTNGISLVLIGFTSIENLEGDLTTMEKWTLGGKDCTSVGDYVKKLEEAYDNVKRERDLLSEKYTSILIAFSTISDDVKKL